MPQTSAFLNPLQSIPQTFAFHVVNPSPIPAPRSDKETTALLSRMDVEIPMSESKYSKCPFPIQASIDVRKRIQPSIHLEASNTGTHAAQASQPSGSRSLKTDFKRKNPSTSFQTRK